MKNILQIILITIFTNIATLPIHSQTSQVQSSTVNISSKQITKNPNNVFVSMQFDLDQTIVNRNDMIVLTPILRSKDNTAETIALPPVVITGGVRNKIIKRKEKLEGKTPFTTNPLAIVKRKNKTKQFVNYQITTPYKQWMDNASLTVSQVVSGCANCYSEVENKLIAYTLFPAPAPKQDTIIYKLTYIVPEVEPVKARSDRHTATFNYIVDQYKLLRNYKNNKVQFDQVDRIISEIQANSDLQITEFAITGYASPEGGFGHNKTLAENRAQSFADYLITKFNVAPNKFTVTSLGEDWEGLRKAVSTSSLSDKQAILSIIDNITNPDARDQELIKLSRGETYKNLLNNYYPALRRTDYVIAYVVRAFNVEEAKKIIRTNPKLLSLNEIYLVATSYAPESKEFKEIFDIATHLYPSSDIAIINSASANIDCANYDAAIEHLKKIEEKPKSWNNLGVAYALKGDLEKAFEYFKKSAESGDPDGQYNLALIQKINRQI